MISTILTIGAAPGSGRGAIDVLMQVDPATFVQNLFLIIGALIFLALVALGVLAIWIGVKCLLFFHARHKAQVAYFRQSHRADGKRYPPAIEGVCETCKRGGKTIYFPEGGVAMCPDCYEKWWPLHGATARPVAKHTQTRPTHPAYKEKKIAGG